MRRPVGVSTVGFGACPQAAAWLGKGGGGERAIPSNKVSFPFVKLEAIYQQRLKSLQSPHLGLSASLYTGLELCTFKRWGHSVAKPVGVTEHDC